MNPLDRLPGDPYLPPGTTSRMIDEQWACFCRGCSRSFEPEDDEDLCPKCAEYEKSLEEEEE